MADIPLSEALRRRRTVRRYGEGEISAAAMERLLFAAEGVTDIDGRRAVPSAHAVYPIRIMVTAARVEGLAPGLYESDAARRELRLVEAGDARPSLSEAAIDAPPWVAEAACVLTLCGDFATATRTFADQPPQGRRGARYVHMEAGAMAQNLQLQAVAEGLGAVLVGGLHDEATANALRLEAPLEPVLHLCLGVPLK